MPFITARARIYFLGNKIACKPVMPIGDTMTDTLKNETDGIDRRGFLRCMAWAGSGVAWSLAGGVPSSKLLGQTASNDGFRFVQISDSHIGFNKPANADVNA